MSYVSMWLRHSTGNAAAAEPIASFVSAAAMSHLRWTSMLKGYRRHGRRGKNRKAVADQIAATKSEGVELEDGKREVESYACFSFDHGTDNPYPVPHGGEFVGPVGTDLERQLADFRRLCVELKATVGYVSVEPTFAEAQNVALGGNNSATAERADMTDRRQRERLAQSFHLRQYVTKLPAVHWGICLSAGHLATVPPATLEGSPAFHSVEQLSSDLVWLKLSPDPLDCIGSDYNAMLDAARDELAPLLTDISDIELDPRS